MIADEVVIKLIDSMVEALDKIAKVLEHKPDLVGILTAHDACLTLKKTCEKASARLEVEHGKA